MTEREILAVFTRVLRDLLSDDSINLTMETERANVANWDSMAYVNFIVSVELALGIKFKVADVESAQNVGQIVSIAKAKLG